VKKGKKGKKEKTCSSNTVQTADMSNADHSRGASHKKLTDFLHKPCPQCGCVCIDITTQTAYLNKTPHSTTHCDTFAKGGEDDEKTTWTLSDERDPEFRHPQLRGGAGLTEPDTSG
jgi:hypothetical protein